MMRISLSVTYADGSGAEVIAAAPDLIAFERHFDKPMSVFAADARIEYILWIAWTALTRRKKITSDFDAWVETVESVTAGDPGEVVPLESNQPTG